MNLWSHERLKAWFKNNAHLYDVAEAWLGDEPNSINKDWNDPLVVGRWLHMAPYSYTELVGNYSVPLIHKYLNTNTRWLADRAYGLASRREDKLYERAGVPIFGAGQKRSMGDYHVVGVSLNFAPLVQTTVRALQLADIPRRYEERAEMDRPYPVLIAGANVFGQPMTSAPIFDLVWCGDLEDEPDDNGDTSWNPGINYYLELTADWIQEKHTDGRQAYYTKEGREAYFRDIVKKCPWIFAPRFYKTSYVQVASPDTTSGLTWKIDKIETTVPEAPLRVKKRIVRELDRVAPLEAPFVSYFDPEGMGAGQVEVARGCSAKSVRGDTLVTMADGSQLPISEIVDSKLKAPVMGYDIETGEMLPAMIQGYSKAEDDEPWLMVQTTFNSTRSGRPLFVTADHRVWTQDGWAEGRELQVGDQIQVIASLPASTRDVLFGSLMGDHSVRGDTLSRRMLLLQPETQQEYFDWKREVLLKGCNVARTRNEDNSYAKSGVGGPRADVSGSEVALMIAQFYGYGKNNRRNRTITRDLLDSYMSPAALAVWYMDDGSRLTNRVEARIIIGNLDETSANAIVDWLNERGFDGCIGRDERRNHYHFTMRSEGSHRFYAHIAPYVHPTMQYKLFEQYRTNEAPVERQGDSPIQGTALITRIVPLTTRYTHYDIQTDTENFIANGVVVHNCTFCAAAYRYAPFRVRNEDNVFKALKESYKNTGATELAPLTLEFGTYPGKKKLIKRVLETLSDTFSAPALRVDNVAEDSGFTLMMSRARKDQIALAVEGCSQRLRQSVTKGLDSTAIVQAVSHAIQAGMKRIKIYMISDLPGETIEDDEELVELIDKLDFVKRACGRTNVQIRFSFTPLLVQANTPLQWLPIGDGRTSLKFVTERLRAYGMGFSLGRKSNRGRQMFAQLFEIGDRIAGEAILEVAEQLKMSYFGAFPKGTDILIEKALAKRGRCIEDYWRGKDADETFEWDIIDLRIKKSYMWRLFDESMSHLYGGDYAVRRKALGPGYLPSGSKCVDRCDGCGACDAVTYKNIAEMDEEGDDRDVRLSEVRVIDQTTIVQKMRMKLWIEPTHRFVRIGHWRNQLRRAAALSGLKIAKRHIKSTSDSVKYRNWMAGVEFVEIGLQQRLGTHQAINNVVMRLNEHLLHCRVDDAQVFPKGVDSMRASKVYNIFRIQVSTTVNHLRSEVAAIMANPDAKMKVHKEQHQRGLEVVMVPVHKHVRDLWVEQDGLYTYLMMVISGSVNPHNVIQAVHSQRPGHEFRYPAVRMESVIPAEDGNDDFLISNCPKCNHQHETNIMGMEVPVCLECRKAGDLERRFPVEHRIQPDQLAMLSTAFTDDDLPEFGGKIGTTDVELDDFDETDYETDDTVHAEGGRFEDEDYNAKWASWEDAKGEGTGRVGERDLTTLLDVANGTMPN